jgi:5-methylcytosine-specific restriction endonuclease McrA
MARRGKQSEVVPELTESQYWSAIRSALRTGMRFWKPKLNALNKAKRPYKGENKKQKWCYECASCGELFKLQEVQCDHVIPAGTLLAYNHLPQFAEKLYCGEDGFQVLCSECHRKKSNEERKTGAYKNGQL